MKGSRAVHRQLGAQFQWLAKLTRERPQLGLCAYLMLVAVVGSLGCDRAARSVRPINHAPRFVSIEVNPPAFALGDSVVIDCPSVDEDGDAVYYDWSTDGRLDADGEVYGHIYGTARSRAVVRAGPLATAPDTAYVWCNIFDQHGGGMGAIISVFLVEATPESIAWIRSTHTIRASPSSVAIE
ncbi:MAG: hypothetical protein HZA61_09420 [Candidatus Eisenbacteria bacterium]|uniref:Ig-like domain-containing protein n=1 Tax=Eiseniibacteriota bacterium TaxID=2212470 RepID=A0A933SDH1_UNCEI|nr:hypothetical protein [Candidatus Eisenbacteria bacterium]